MTITRAIFSVTWLGGYFFTTSKLLKSRSAHLLGRDSFSDFLRHPQGSRIVHSFCTRGKGFSVAGRDILRESGFSEYVAILKACRTMFAVTLVAAGNSRG
jgi:hypothetical protein